MFYTYSAHFSLDGFPSDCTLEISGHLAHITDDPEHADKLARHEDCGQLMERCPFEPHKATKHSKLFGYLAM